MEDTSYRRLEDGAVPRQSARVATPRWRPGPPLVAALILSIAIWAGIIFGLIRLWRYL